MEGGKYLLTDKQESGKVPLVPPKYKLTISVTEEVVEQMKIRAVKEKRSVGEIAEELFWEYLKRPLPKK
jgi:hypothetical protein